jgi:hypothetical protein
MVNFSHIKIFRQFPVFNFTNDLDIVSVSWQIIIT